MTMFLGAVDVSWVQKGEMCSHRNAIDAFEDVKAYKDHRRSFRVADRPVPRKANTDEVTKTLR